MGCCECTTKFREEHVYATLYLEKMGEGTGVPPIGDLCMWKFEYTKPGPEEKYTVFKKRLASRKLEAGSTFPSNGCCINAADGIMQYEYPQGFPEIIDCGIIYKKLQGIWYSFYCSPNHIGYKRVPYKKKLKFETSFVSYTNTHWCGETCPGKDWPASRRYNKRQELINLAKSYQA